MKLGPSGRTYIRGLEDKKFAVIQTHHCELRLDVACLESVKIYSIDKPVTHTSCSSQCSHPRLLSS